MFFDFTLILLVLQALRGVHGYQLDDLKFGTISENNYNSINSACPENYRPFVVNSRDEFLALDDYISTLMGDTLYFANCFLDNREVGFIDNTGNWQDSSIDETALEISGIFPNNVNSPCGSDADYPNFDPALFHAGEGLVDMGDAGCHSCYYITCENLVTATTICEPDFAYNPNEWNLVRRVPASSSTWHQATDNLAGTDVYGVWKADEQSRVPEFSIFFADLDFDHFKLSTGDGVHWVVFTKTELLDAAIAMGSGACNTPLELSTSDISEEPYEVLICNREIFEEDPWISNQDHGFGGTSSISDTENHSMLYGENNHRGWHFWVQNHEGANVFIRKGHPHVWHFSNTGDTYTDSTGSFTFSTVSRNPLIVPSIDGEGLWFQPEYFEGLSAPVEGTFISDPSLSNSQLSFSFWVKIEGGRFILSSGAQTSSRGIYVLRTDTQYDKFSDRIEVGIKDGVHDWRITHPDVEMGIWTHFAVTLDGTRMRLYKNGLFLASVYPGDFEVDDVHTTLDLGYPSNTRDTAMAGFFEIDELKFWDYTLSDGQVWDVSISDFEPAERCACDSQE